MADLADHINQAKHNEACAAHLLSEKTYRDWAITATFYAAVHFAESAFNSIEQEFPFSGSFAITVEVD